MKTFTLESFQSFVDNKLNEKMIPKKLVKEIIKERGWAKVKSITPAMAKLIEPKVKKMIAAGRDIDIPGKTNKELSPWVNLDWFTGLSKDDDVILWAEHGQFKKGVYLIVGNLKGDLHIHEYDQELAKAVADQYSKDLTWANFGHAKKFY